jgi:hypothetical protein
MVVIFCQNGSVALGLLSRQGGRRHLQNFDRILTGAPHHPVEAALAEVVAAGDQHARHLAQGDNVILAENGSNGSKITV